MDNVEHNRVIVQQLQKKIQDIDFKLSGSLDALKKFIEAHHLSTQHNEEDGEGGQTTAGGQSPIDYHALQLVLQYRLNSHDILKSLFLCQQSLWQILGVCPANSSEVNYERLAYALGSDDFHVLLSTLNQLVDTLIRVIAQNQKNNKNKLRQTLQLKKSNQASSSVAYYEDLPEKNLQDGLRLQKEAVVICSEAEVILETLRNGEALVVGPMLDEIAALGEPISRLYQALEYGFELSGSIFQQMSMEYGVSASLTHIIEKLNNLGQKITPNLVLKPIQDTHQAFFSPEHRKISQTVEEEANRLRLSNFFK